MDHVPILSGQALFLFVNPNASSARPLTLVSVSEEGHPSLWEMQAEFSHLQGESGAPNSCPQDL